MLLGLSRADAARFTFLLSIPIITLAGGKKLLDVITGDAGDVQLDLVLVGMVTAGIVGYFTVKYLLQYLAHHALDVFAYYRFALAGVILMVLAF
jgi:undecaprenyl-diphosphatase